MSVKHVLFARFDRVLYVPYQSTLNLSCSDLIFYSYAFISVMFRQLWPLFSSCFFTLFHSGRAPPALLRFNAATRERTEKFHIFNIRQIFFAHLFPPSFAVDSVVCSRQTPACSRLFQLLLLFRIASSKNSHTNQVVKFEHRTISLWNSSKLLYYIIHDI